MALHFAGMMILKDDEETLDPQLQGRGRCLMILEMCTRYMAEVNVLIQPGHPPSLEAIQNATNLLAINMIKITRSDVVQLREDVDALAETLGIVLSGVCVNPEVH